MPHGGNFGLACFRLALALATFVWLRALLLHVSRDQLGCHTGRQRSVLAAFEQARDNDLRIAPRGDADEPAVILKLRPFPSRSSWP